MTHQQRQNSSRLGATFIPGGTDDFYMPEVISPSPQRVTPEVPEKIQDNLAHLELEASPVNRLSGLQSPSPIEPRRSSVANSISQNYPAPTNSDQPTFSPFPPLRNRSANVPPSDEEKEAVLEKARLPVLSANDPEVQLSWAQDTLAFVEIASQYQARISPNPSSRPQTPSTEHQLRVDAVNVVSFLADQSHPKAEFLRGMWLEFGKFGFRMDKKEAFRCYQRAAQRGYARAEYRMGMQFENSNEPDKALKHYQLGVDAGDSASNYRIGMMTLLGQHNQPLDYAKGINMISYAAETADENAPQGAYVFGMLQSRELTQVSVPEQFLALNISGARYNIEKAAYLGFAKAQAKMGVAYELCQLGCDFNPALSLHYNALASRQGEAEADMSISKWFLCGYEGVFDKNEELAFTYAQRAAQSGLPNAEFAMGYFYEVGIYVRVDLRASRSWYEKAADHGNKDAASRIDGIARSKTLSRKDHEQTAVAKIKSQYGSHKGKRPERFKQPETMPTISDDTVDMPEPRLPPPRQQQGPPYPGAYGNQGFGARPSSAAPYPVDDGRGRPPQTRPSTGPTYQNYAPPRRGSNMPPTSTAEGDSSYGDSNYRGSAFPTFKPQPPAGPGSGPGRVPQVPSNNIQPSPGAQNYRRPVSGQSTPYGHGSPNLGSSRPSTQPPAIDIGFSAPPDLSSADRRRLQKPASNRPLPPGTLPRNSSYDGPQNIPPRDRLAGPPHPSTMPSHGRTASPARVPLSVGRPSGAATPPVNPQLRPDSMNPVPSLPPKLQDPAGPGRAANTPPPNAPIARPPGKGPKTFQEMGVPPSKNESDCPNDIAINLAKHSYKAHVIEALRNLSEAGLIVGIGSVNRVVYHALQHSQDDTTIAHLDKEVADLRESVAALRMDQRALSSRLASVSCPLPTRELQPMVESLEGERTMLRDRLTWLSVEDFTSLLPEQRADVNRQWSIWSRKAAARKAMALELWRIVTELLPEGRSRDTLWEELDTV